jgi:hypothetical protein
VSENPREFEQESLRLNEGLKSCRTVVDNYRAMMSGGQGSDSDEEDLDISHYVSTTGSSAGSYQGNPTTN